MTHRRLKAVLAGLLVVAGAIVLAAGVSWGKPDKVDGVNVPFGRVPQEIKNNRYPRTYYPNTEKVGANEMRIVALGTGMPNQSPSTFRDRGLFPVEAAG